MTTPSPKDELMEQELQRHEDQCGDCKPSCLRAVWSEAWTKGAAEGLGRNISDEMRMHIPNPIDNALSQFTADLRTKIEAKREFFREDGNDDFTVGTYRGLSIALSLLTSPEQKASEDDLYINPQLMTEQIKIKVKKGTVKTLEPWAGEEESTP